VIVDLGPGEFYGIFAIFACIPFFRGPAERESIVSIRRPKRLGLSTRNPGARAKTLEPQTGPTRFLRFISRLSFAVSSKRDYNFVNQTEMTPETCFLAGTKDARLPARRRFTKTLAPARWLAGADFFFFFRREQKLAIFGQETKNK